MPIIDDFRMFGDIFKELRLEKGISQDKVASDLDVSQGLIARWENHSSTPGPEMLIYISDYFGVSVDYLVGKSKYKNLEASNTEIDNQIIEKSQTLGEDNKKLLLNILDAINKKN